MVSHFPHRDLRSSASPALTYPLSSCRLSHIGLLEFPEHTGMLPPWELCPETSFVRTALPPIDRNATDSRVHECNWLRFATPQSPLFYLAYLAFSYSTEHHLAYSVIYLYVYCFVPPTLHIGQNRRSVRSRLFFLMSFVYQFISSAWKSAWHIVRTQQILAEQITGHVEKKIAGGGGQG